MKSATTQLEKVFHLTLYKKEQMYLRCLSIELIKDMILSIKCLITNTKKRPAKMDTSF